MINKQIHNLIFKPFKAFFKIKFTLYSLFFFIVVNLFIVNTTHSYNLQKDTITVNKLIKEAKAKKKNKKEVFRLSKDIVELSKKNQYKFGLFEGYFLQGNVLLHDYQYTKALKNFQLAYENARFLKSDISEAEALFNIAYCYQSLDEPTKAVDTYKKCLAKGKQDTLLIADVHTNLGVSYDYSGDYGKAIVHYLESYTLNKALKNNKALGTSSSNLGQLFSTLKIYDKAIYYLKKSEAIAISLRDTATLCYAYENLGANYLSKNELLKAKFYLEKALKLAKAMNLQEYEIVSLTYSNLGMLAIKNKAFDKAEAYLDTALNIANEKSLTFHKTFALTHQIDLLNKQNKLEEAEEIAQKALDLCRNTNQTPLKVNILEFLKETYAKQGMFEKAFNTQKDALKLEKSLKLEDNLKQVAVLIATRDYDKKKQIENLIKNQKQKVLESKILTQRYTLGFVVFILMILGIFTFISVRNQQLQKRINEDLAQKNHEIEISRIELNKQSQAFSDLNNHKDQIFTIISHDLRKPIGHLSSVLELLENNILDADDFKSFIPQISKNVKDTSEILDSLLFWAKSQLKGFSLKITEQNLFNFINEKTASLQPFAKEKNISIINQINPEVKIKIDAMLSMIIIRNLILNAIKFSDENKEIIIQLEEHTNHFEIKVKDSGIGMSQEQIDNLFTTKNKSTLGTKKEKGTGLGLYFCNDLVKKCGGEFKVKSVLGEGSTFSFTIPKYTA
jgi:signal transduction histidine kinase/uncharacterized protein HemY